MSELLVVMTALEVIGVVALIAWFVILYRSGLLEKLDAWLHDLVSRR